ncbi:MAG: F0F1 ATP synthase subunit A [Acidimicrobiia bacterium]|nr:F0F1 ATP synthase subunit A [Acidimicrobiia bacterium]
MIAAGEGGGLHYPSIEDLVEWPGIPAWEGAFYDFNKIAFINVLAVILTSMLFIFSDTKSLVPRGFRNLAEMAVDFFDKGIIGQTIGHGGEKYLPFIASIFFFVFFANIFEVIPLFHMPASARMATPLFLGVLTLVFFVAVGLKHQGPKYFFNACFPPGVPKPLYLLVAPIEFLSTFIVRPFSLAVRLFANLLAGHILIVTFGVLSITLFTASALVLILPFSFLMLCAMVGFEIMVSFLQAYVFAILAAVYIGGALHPEH